MALSGAVIITTTSEAVANQYAHGPKTIALEPFRCETGAELLMKLSGLGGSDPEEEEAARVIADSVGGLPLALDLVGSYLGGLRKPLSSFWREHPCLEDDFLFNPNLSDWTPAHFEKSISRIWALHRSAGVLGPRVDLHHKSGRLMNMLAFLDKDGVPLSMFQRTIPQTM